MVAIAYCIGAILVAVACGMLSQNLSGRHSIVAAAALAVPLGYLAAYSEMSCELAIGAFVLGIALRRWRLALYAVLLMTAFNFFSHGTQDIYPTFLQVQHKFDAHTTGTIAIIYNIGAILGGWTFGALSQSLGRRRTIVAAAALSVPVSYLWAYSETATMLAVGAFLMQFFVQGAWGVIPAHLNELAPASARGTFPGTVYQLGNFLASYNAVLQTGIAAKNGENYSFALISVAIAAACAIVLLTALGREARDVKMHVRSAA